MSSELEDFHRQLLQEVRRDADVDGRYSEDAFFEHCCEYLVDEGDIETADRAHYSHPSRGIRIDGYGGDPTSSEGVLSLILLDFNQAGELERLTASEMDAIFKRGLSFLSKSLESSFRRSLEETSAGFGLADMIAGTWEGTRKVKFILISNRRLSTRVDGRKAGEIQGTPVVYSVWDVERLFRSSISGSTREYLSVDLSEHGGSLPALKAHLNDAGYESYLLVMPAHQLASIYDQWGPRLLEQNVRVFLQARGGVNKGIRNTIENDPEMFFAYNNGVTATAESVEGAMIDGQYSLKVIQNLQIVNGGQTTASIYAASRRRNTELSKVFVQMKLSVIPPIRAEVVVPKISEYANSQNKVNAADFFSNHPFHLRIKEFSSLIFAPSQDGSFRDTKWFYERARGQYEDAKSNLTMSERKKFELEFPKRQVFSKTDLAKFANVWSEIPHIVSRGAQKNFANFAGTIGKAWEERPNQFNESFFRQLISKAIFFREAERIVSVQPWYEGGYRANIVAYALAKIAHDVRAIGESVNFDQIWRAQSVSSAAQGAIEVAAHAAMSVLTDPSAGMKNVTEWAKQPACWNRVSALRIVWSQQWLSELISAADQQENLRVAIKEQRVLNGIEAQMAVVNAGAFVWKQIREWAIDRQQLSEKELEILGIACMLPTKVPTERQSLALIKALEKLRQEGCVLGSEIR